MWRRFRESQVERAEADGRSGGIGGGAAELGAVTYRWNWSPGRRLAGSSGERALDQRHSAGCATV